MKRIVYFIAFMAVVFIAASCGDKKKNAESNMTEVAKDSAAVDTTLYGTCGEGTSMNSLQLITDNGKTLEFTMQGEDTSSNVLGGLLSGDRLAVIACKTADGEMFAQTVINITSLFGKWSSIDRSFTIEEGGVVEGDQQEQKTYVDWRILNGKLILTSDTFSIYSLGPDSLLLENANGIYAYKRVMK